MHRPSFEEIKGLYSAPNFYNDGNADENEEWEDEFSSNEDDDLYYEKAVEEDYEDDDEEFEVRRWEGGDDDMDDDIDEEDDDSSQPLPDLDERMVYAIALRAAAQLEAGGFINHMQKANLKEKILDANPDIISIVIEFVETNEASKLMLVFQRISKQVD